MRDATLKFARVGRGAFLREFNENRNWICSLRGITPVVPPPLSPSCWFLNPRVGPEKSCPFRSHGSPCFRRAAISPRRRTDNQIDFSSPEASRTILFPLRLLWPTRPLAVIGHIIYFVYRFNVFSYIITEYAIFPRAQHFASQCLMIVYRYESIVS